MNRKREIGDFSEVICKNGWSVLETESHLHRSTVSYYKDFWIRPGDKILTKVIVVAGEWNPKTSDQPNRFFVRGTTHTSDYHLFKYIKLESTENKVMEIMEKTDKKFELLYDEWISKYDFNPNKEPLKNYEEPVWY